MNDKKGFTVFTSGLLRTVLFVILLALLLAAAVRFNGMVIAFTADRFTEYRIGYKEWAGDPLNGSFIKDLRFEDRNSGLVVTAESAFLDIRLKESLLAKKLIVDCWAEDVVFSTGNNELKGPGNSPTFATPFDPGCQYRYMVFAVLLSPGCTVIEGFRAIAESPRNDKFIIKFNRLEIK